MFSNERYFYRFLKIYRKTPVLEIFKNAYFTEYLKERAFELGSIDVCYAWIS